MTGSGKEYGTALFELALTGGCCKEVSDSLERIGQALKETPEYLDFLSSPAIPVSERTAGVEAAFGEDEHEYAVSLLCVLTRRGHARLFDSCRSEYEALYRESSRQAQAEVTSAVALTEEEKARMQRELERRSGKSVSVRYRIDEKLLGGVVVEMDGVRMDGSLKRRLQAMKEVMEK